MKKSEIKNCELFIFDLDGVIYRGKKILPYAKKTVNYLLKNNYKVFFLTNNSTKTREQYQEKLQNLGISVSAQNIMTSAYATALYFQEKNIKKANVLVIGGEGIIKELQSIGLNILYSSTHQLTSSPTINIDYVVVGLDVDFNYNKLAFAQKAILQGAKFIATNTDATFPKEDGLAPGGGSIVSAIRTATNKKPIVIGKPQVYSLKKILHLSKTKQQDAVIIGDRIETDITLGKKIKIKTILVLTGVTKKEDIYKTPKKYKPHYVIETLKELYEIIVR